MQETVKYPIITEAAFDELLLASEQNPSQTYAIFKHSTRCSISSMALNRMQKANFLAQFNVPFYYLDLIQYRNISNYIAQKLQIVHESPQIIMIKGGKSIAHASHSHISLAWIEDTITQ